MKGATEAGANLSPRPHVDRTAQPGSHERGTSWLQSPRARWRSRTGAWGSGASRGRSHNPSKRGTSPVVLQPGRQSHEDGDEAVNGGLAGHGTASRITWRIERRKHTASSVQNHKEQTQHSWKCAHAGKQKTESQAVWKIMK